MEKREKIILVTGSTGFLGSAITRRLLVSGCKLRLLIRKRDNDTSQISFGWESLIEELILGNQLEEYSQEQCHSNGTCLLTMTWVFASCLG